MIVSRKVTCAQDMDAIEAGITSYLRCENGKCSFFRQADYIRLRLAALYSASVAEPVTLFHKRIKITLSQDKTVEVSEREAHLKEEDDKQEQCIYFHQQEHE